MLSVRLVPGSLAPASCRGHGLYLVPGLEGSEGITGATASGESGACSVGSL